MTSGPPVRRIGGLDILALDAAEAVAMIVAAVEARAPRVFAFCNAHTVNVARARPDFAAAAQRATLFNDGVGMDIASRVLHGAPFPANLNGTDLTPALLAALPADTGVFLLGSPPEIAERAMAALGRRHPQLRFVGAHHGFIKRRQEPALAERIRASGAALVLVGMGHPHQELWAARNRDAVGAVSMCIGAFFDFTVGAVPRAPRWARAARIEWAVRLFHEPRRMARRYLIGNAAFLIAVTRERLRRAR